MRRNERLLSQDVHGCFFALLYKGIQRKNKQTEYGQVCKDVALKILTKQKVTTRCLQKGLGSGLQ